MTHSDLLEHYVGGVIALIPVAGAGVTTRRYAQEIVADDESWDDRSFELEASYGGSPQPKS
jgi:hypothetical protein